LSFQRWRVGQAWGLPEVEVRRLEEEFIGEAEAGAKKRRKGKQPLFLPDSDESIGRTATVTSLGEEGGMVMEGVEAGGSGDTEGAAAVDSDDEDDEDFTPRRTKSRKVGSARHGRRSSRGHVPSSPTPVSRAAVISSSGAASSTAPGLRLVPAGFREELATLSHRLGEREGRVGQLEAELERERAAFSNLTAVHGTTIINCQMAEARVQELSAQLEEEESTSARLRRERNEADINIRALGAECDEFRRTVVAREKEVDELRAALRREEQVHQDQVPLPVLKNWINDWYRDLSEALVGGDPVEITAAVKGVMASINARLKHELA
jgi:hypothetical protein